MTTNPNTFNAAPGNMILDATTGAFLPAETFVDSAGQLVAPPGYAFVDAYVQQPGQNGCPGQPPVMFSPMNAPMASPMSFPPAAHANMAFSQYPPNAYNQARPTARRRNNGRWSRPQHNFQNDSNGVKQELIDIVHNACKEYFTRQGTFVCIRNEVGGQTIRITLKKLESLRKIRSTIAKLNNAVEVEEFSMHILFRNRKQHQSRRKAGLTMYVKLKNEADTPTAFEILQADEIPVSLVMKQQKPEAKQPQMPILTQKKSSTDAAKPKMPSFRKQASLDLRGEDEDFEPPLPPRAPKRKSSDSDEDFSPPIPLLRKRSSAFSLQLENGEVIELQYETDGKAPKLTANSSLELQDILSKY